MATAYALVNKRMMFLGEWREPGDVVDVTGARVHALLATGHLAVLPSDPEILERFATKIREIQAGNDPDKEVISKDEEEEAEEENEEPSEPGDPQEPEEPNSEEEPSPSGSTEENGPKPAGARKKKKK